jgi:predicted nucleotidyltransferase
MAELIEQQISKYFQQHPEGIACVYLFGSRARRQSKSGSDVDIAVLYKDQAPSGLERLGIPLSGTLEKIIGKPLDVVVLNGASVDLIHRILRDGIILYEADRSARINFEVTARNAYFDLKPYLDEYRRAG